jgi:hypothetical protein
MRFRRHGRHFVLQEYTVAKQKIAEIAARMNAIGDTSAEYFTLNRKWKSTVPRFS